jgi:hypothetical protein
MKYSQATSHVIWLKSEKTNLQGAISVQILRVLMCLGDQSVTYIYIYTCPSSLAFCDKYAIWSEGRSDAASLTKTNSNHWLAHHHERGTWEGIYIYDMDWFSRHVNPEDEDGDGPWNAF